MSENDLGNNADNILYLGECISQLPINLQYFYIDLCFNDLGENKENM